MILGILWILIAKFMWKYHYHPIYPLAPSPNIGLFPKQRRRLSNCFGTGRFTYWPSIHRFLLHSTDLKWSSLTADPCPQTNSLIISKTWRTFLLGSAQTFGMPWRLLNLPPPQTEGSRFPLLSSNVVLFFYGDWRLIRILFNTTHCG